MSTDGSMTRRLTCPRSVRHIYLRIKGGEGKRGGVDGAGGLRLSDGTLGGTSACLHYLWGHVSQGDPSNMLHV
jgi:hypothetical protein